VPKGSAGALKAAPVQGLGAEHASLAGRLQPLADSSRRPRSGGKIMNQYISSSASKFVVLAAAAAVALSSATGCLPRGPAVRSPRSGAAFVVDRATCVDRHIQSIWKGEDIAGSACAGFIAREEFALEAERRRIQKVCERAQIRTILTGEAPAPFTRQTCAARAMLDAPPAIRRTCWAVARAQSLNSVQRAACSEYLTQELALRG
jgi:hypothetical protein